MKNRYNRFYLISILLCGALNSTAQNMPDLSQVKPADSSYNRNHTTPPAPSLGSDLNKVSSYVPLVPIQAVGSVTGSAPADEVRAVFDYRDGFNRSFQTLARNYVQSGVGYADLVKVADNRPLPDPYDYPAYSALHTANIRSNAFTEQRNFYHDLYPDEQQYTCFSSSSYHSDANTRQTFYYQPGKSQTGQGRMSSDTKVSNDANQVRIWSLNASGLPVSNGFYPANRLLGSKVTDQSGHSSVTFTDKGGRMVLKAVEDSFYTQNVSGGGVLDVYTYQKTYYVYDDQGRLRYILPPKATEAIEAAGWSVSAAVRNNLCFQYQYDDQGRLSAQQKPGETGLTYIVYDRKQRPVMRQTPNERVGTVQWEVTFYDQQGRAIATGLFNNTGSRATWQNFFDNYAGAGYATSNIRYYLVTDAGEGKYPPETGVTNVTPMSYTWYDDYAALDANNALFSNCINTLDFDDTLSIPGSEQPLRSGRTNGLVTGSKVRILPAPGANPAKTGDWRQSYTWYDDKGRVIFTLNKDLYQGNAIHTHYTGSQYDFNNRLLISKHISINSNSADGATTHTELTKNIYEDVTGNLIETGHQVDGGPWKILSKYEYDALGRVKREVLGNYGEVRDYDYNIRGQLTGINGEYAETGSAAGYQQSRSFGESLKYDYGMTHIRHDGKIAGMIWRGTGGTDATMMSYGYDYDRSGRISQADYYQYREVSPGVDQWDHTLDDRTVKGLYYDKNGNILSMTQRGTAATPTQHATDIDHMSYAYAANSNQLLSVSDTVSVDYGVGDFQEGHTDGPDYSYDANGNLSKDLNKNINNITYTYFNRPQTITFGNGATISYSYDAGGSKVQELVTEGTQIKRTDYIGNLVYQNDSVQYISTAAGRTVWQNDTAKEEFFVKDHLGNVRSVVDVFTYPPVAYLASYEIASANLETMIFDQVDEIRDDKPNTTDPEDQQAGRLNGTDSALRIGTSLLLKVMAGDKVELSVDNYYESYTPENDEPINAEDLVGSIVSTLQGGAGGFEGSESHNPGLVEKLFSPENYLTADELMHTEPDETKPKAFLNYILFNNRMEVVSKFTGAFQVNGSGAWSTIGTTAPLVIPEGGYLAVFESTQTAIYCDGCEESASDVYFDQLMIRFTRGQLKEESHYYPFGLPMGDMGSAATGFTPNRRKYQGNEYIQDAGLNWMDFHARQYDPQIGRFLSIDPLAVSGGQDKLSPYAAMGNEPVGNTDPGGTIFGVHEYNLRVPKFVLPPISPSSLKLLGVGEGYIDFSASYNSDDGADSKANKAFWNLVMEAVQNSSGNQTIFSGGLLSGNFGPGAGGSPDGYTLHDDGSVDLTDKNTDKSNTFFDESGNIILTVGENLEDAFLGKGKAWDVAHIALGLDNVDLNDMQTRSKKNGWDATNLVNEFKRLRSHSQQMLFLDAAAGFTPLAPIYPTQNTREGRPSSILGIFFNKVDSWYSAISSGRDLQTDVIRAPQQAGSFLRSNITNWISQFNMWPVYNH